MWAPSAYCLPLMWSPTADPLLCQHLSRPSHYSTICQTPEKGLVQGSAEPLDIQFASLSPS